MSGNGSEDHRRDRRVCLAQDVECELDSGRFHWRVADISAGGMFIDVPEPFPPGTVFKMSFGLGDPDPPIVAMAEVNYIQERIGMGVRFRDLAPEDRHRIEAMVDRMFALGPQRGDATLRRSARVLVHIPVQLGGADGVPARFDEDAAIVKLSKYGGCVSTTRELSVGEKLRLFTTSGRQFLASIVWVGDQSTKTGGQIGIQCRGLAQALGFQFP
jgi:PilZ domain-containing protein